MEVTTYKNSAFQGDYVAGIDVIIPADPHDVPAMAYHAASGTMYLAYGAHSSSLKINQTASANDPSRWLISKILDAGSYGVLTFYKLFVVGNTLYVIYFTSGAGIGQQEAVAFTSATINPATGALTWSGATKRILDVATAGNDGWVLSGQSIVVGTNIYITFALGTNIGAYPVSNTYCVILDTTTLNIKNLGGGTSIAPASQPASKATLDASFKALTSTNTSCPGIAVDGAGDIHIVNADNQDIVYTKGSGSTWSAPFALYTIGNGLGMGVPPGLVINAAGGLDVYFVDGANAASTSYATGSGNQWVRTRALNGTWNTATKLLSYSGNGGFNEAMPVKDAGPKIRVMFMEVSIDGSTIVGNLKGYAYGDGGLVGRSSFGSIPTPASLDPTKAPAGVTLSNNNMTATATATASHNVGAFIGVASGKYYCEFIFGVNSTGNSGVGIQNANQSSTAYIGGAGSNSLGVYPGGAGSSSIGNTFALNVANFVAGDVVRLAIDKTINRAWVAVNAGLWSGGAGPQAIGIQDPANGIGGIDISAIAGKVAPVIDVETNGDSCTVRLSSAEFTYGAPSGFNDWKW